MINQMWHDRFGVNAADSYFIIGGNPDQSGGGVIASTSHWHVAWTIMQEAVRHGYKSVEILSNVDFFNMKES